MRLQKINYDFKYADRVVSRIDPQGMIFEFYDSTHCHGQFQLNNPICHPPVGTIGAVRKDDRTWWWIIEVENNDT